MGLSMLSSPKSEGAGMSLLSLAEDSDWLSSETFLATISFSRNASKGIDEVVGVT